MLKRVIALCMVLVLGACVFTGCSSSASTKAGDVYIGKWSGPGPVWTDDVVKMEISRNGDSYLIKFYSQDKTGNIDNIAENGASLTKDGMLNMSGNILTHVKADDTLHPDWIETTLKREK